MHLFLLLLLMSVTSLLSAQDMAMISIVTSEEITVDGRAIDGITTLSAILKDEEICNDLTHVWNHALIDSAEIPKENIRFTISISLLSRGIQYDVLLCKDSDGNKSSFLKGTDENRKIPVEQALVLINRFSFLKVTLVK